MEVEVECAACNGYGCIDPTEKLDFETGKFSKDEENTMLVPCPACQGRGRWFALTGG